MAVCSTCWAVILAIGSAFNQLQQVPVGADIAGSVSGPMTIIDRAPSRAARNSGPVSLPTTKISRAQEPGETNEIGLANKIMTLWNSRCHQRIRNRTIHISTNNNYRLLGCVQRLRQFSKPVNRPSFLGFGT